MLVDNGHAWNHTSKMLETLIANPLVDLALTGAFVLTGVGMISRTAIPKPARPLAARAGDELTCTAGHPLHSFKRDVPWGAVAVGVVPVCPCGEPAIERDMRGCVTGIHLATGWSHPVSELRRSDPA
jgi:hypothetical protein